MRFLIILAVFLILSGSGFSATIHVPGDYKSIQGAINSALDGDVVLVAPGTYEGNIDFLGKAITVKSSDGPNLTVIAGLFPGDVVTFQNGEGLDSELSGFKITNGFGIYCYESSPIIRHNIVTKCLFYGISCNKSASPAIVENTISDNWQGVKCDWLSSPLIKSNVICENKSVPGPDQGGTRGAGIYSGDDCAPLIVNNLIYGNHVYGGTTFVGTWVPGSGGGHLQRRSGHGHQQHDLRQQGRADGR